MKKNLFILVVVLIVNNISAQKYKVMMSSSDYSVKEIVEEANSFFKDKDKGKGSGYKQFKRWEYHAQRNMDENGFLASTYQNQKELERYISRKSYMRTSSTTFEGNWQELGPSYRGTDNSSSSPGVGRIMTVSFDNNDVNHFIVGGDTGGIWESYDYGQSWSVLTDDYTRLNVRSLLISPHDSSEFYWGSTDGLIFRSVDGGNTWSEFTDFTSGDVLKIRISPDNPNVMFAAVEFNGIYKTLDGGANWSLIHSNSVTGYDLEFDPNNANNIMATGNSVFMSRDGGVTFTEDTTSGFRNGPKMLAYSASNSQTIYVLEASSFDGTAWTTFSGLYKSTNGGDTFTKFSYQRNYLATNGGFGMSNHSQAPFHMAIAVNPSNEDEIHIGGIDTIRSTNGGGHFAVTSTNSIRSTREGYCHGDITSMEFHNGELFVTTDGGISKSSNSSGAIDNNYYEDLSTGLGVKQFYKLGISQTNPVIISAGSQDNGTAYMDDSGVWRHWLGADGMETFISKDDSSKMYGTFQWGWLFVNRGHHGIRRPENKGGTIYGSEGYNWVVPFEQDPIIGNRIYVAYDEVYSSTDDGENWQSVSQNFGANVDEFKISPLSSQTQYLSIDDALFKTTDGGATDWQSIASLPNNLGNINSIALNPLNVNEIALAGTGSAKVAFSSDGGDTWQVFNNGLPNFKAKALTFYKGDIVLGMNYGVYVLDGEDKTSWESFSNNLPNVDITELEVNYVTDVLYASTYGRGIWATTLDEQSLSNSTTKDISKDVVFNYEKALNILSISSQEEFSSVKIFNSLGQLVYKNTNIANVLDVKIDTVNLTKGIYFVNLEKNGFVSTKKIFLD